MEKQITKTQEKVDSSELGVMVSLVVSHYPLVDRSDYQKLAILVSKEFEVQVTEDQLIQLTDVSREIEDRMLIYQHCVS